MENDLKGNENWLEFAGGLSSRKSTFWSCVTFGARSKDRVLVTKHLVRHISSALKLLSVCANGYFKLLHGCARITYNLQQFETSIQYTNVTDESLVSSNQIHSDEGLMLETSVFESFTVANLPYRPCG